MEIAEALCVFHNFLLGKEPDRSRSLYFSLWFNFTTNPFLSKTEWDPRINNRSQVKGKDGGTQTERLHQIELLVEAIGHLDVLLVQDGEDVWDADD